MMNERVFVEVSGIEFAAGHFISEAGKCERLHGHNYSVASKLEGEKNAQGVVIDFRILKKHLRDLCTQWDHRFLLPTRSQVIQVTSKKDQIHVKTPDATYSFPIQDVVLLDVVETTTEELARLLCQSLVKKLVSNSLNLHQVSVTVSESSTSHATVTLRL